MTDTPAGPLTETTPAPTVGNVTDATGKVLEATTAPPAEITEAERKARAAAAAAPAPAPPVEE